MSKTALLWVFGYYGGLILGIVNPIFPFISYLIDYYQHPPMRWWGDAVPGSRWSLMAAAVWLVSCLIHGRFPLGTPALRHRQTYWLLGFLIVAFFVTPFAYSVQRSIDYADDLLRLVLLYLMIVVTVQSRQHFRWIVIAMLLGGFTWGYRAWTDPERVAGRLRSIGGPDARNDNAAAAALLPLLPFAAAYALTGSRVQRVVAIISAPFLINTIILCNSRGATVAVAGAGVAAIALTNGKLRKRTVGLVSVGAVLGVLLSDPQFLERQATLLSDERDSSSEGRIIAWKGAIRLMIDHPLGTGGGGFDLLSPRYIPDVVARFDGAERAVHNTYLWVGSDWGIQGLTCFMGYLIGTFLLLQRTRRSTTDPKLALDALCLQIGLVAFMIAAFFINRPYAEMVYWLPGLSAALANIHLADQEQAARAASRPAEAPTLESVPA